MEVIGKAMPGSHNLVVRTPGIGFVLIRKACGRKAVWVLASMACPTMPPKNPIPGASLYKKIMLTKIH